MDLETLVSEAITRYPEMAKQYIEGKEGSVGLFLGEIMRKTKNSANPEQVYRIVEKKLYVYEYNVLIENLRKELVSL